MRNTKPWTTIAIAVPMLLLTSLSTFASPDPQSTTESETTLDQSISESEADSSPVSVVLQLNDSSPLEESTVVESQTIAEEPAVVAGLFTKVRNLAVQFIGTPYRWGGTTPRAFDCSGFTRYIYSKLGVRIPRTARAQFKAGKPVKRGECKPGDLVFFNMAKGYVSHVGMYLGDDKFIHASTPATGVVISKLSQGSYRKCFVGARRYQCA